MEKVIVYSVNINGYDEIITPKEYDPSVRYILFTDNENAKSDVWEIVQVKPLNQTKDLRKKSRYYKTNPHLILPEHEISIYVDANLEPRFTDVKKMLEDIGMDKNNVMSYKHPERNCIFEEANAVIHFKLDSVETVSIQMKRYTNMGFPKNYGLFECGFMIRKNNNKVKNFNETWWTEILKNSGRDQLSQMFSSWYSDVDITPITIGERVESTPYLMPKQEHKRVFQV